MIRLSVPGKSFLAGEYLALKGGPALLFASNPRFELRVSPLAKTNSAGNAEGIVVGIHAESPAGQLVRDNQDFFKNYTLEFIDPHNGRGGWGASTAQFLTVFVMNEWRESVEMETLKSLSISRLLESYWRYAWNGQGTRPSGADLVAQYKGALTLFERRSGLISVYKWPFADIEFALIPTGRKLATHEHLRGLNDFDEAGIESAVRVLQQGLQSSESATFVEGIQAAGKALAQLGFVAEHTVQLLGALKAIPGVLAAKGCGALGADVLFVIYQKAEQTSLEKAVTQLGLHIAASSQNLSRGLEIEVRNS
jgi:mevalonate kinase